MRKNNCIDLWERISSFRIDFKSNKNPFKGMRI